MKSILKKAYSHLKIRVKKNDNPIRWGIIGTGNMAENFGRAIDRNKNGIIQAVVSRTQEKANSFSKKHFNCKPYCDLLEFVKDTNIDVVYVATPIKQHYENIKLCLENNKNVICEKPFTENVEQMTELYEIAKRNGCFLMEGMWMKCLPTYQKAIEWIRDGRIGAVELIKVDFYKNEIINTEYAIFDKNNGGGVLNDYGVYAISFPLGFMSGDVMVQGDSRESQYGIDTDWSIIMKSKNMKAFINISSNFRGTSRSSIIGSEGRIEWESQFNRTNKLVLFDAKGIESDSIEFKYENDGFEYEVNEVQECIKTKKNESSKVTLESTKNTLLIKDNLYKLNGEKFKIKI